MRDWGVCRDCALKENCAEYKPNKLQCEDYEQYKEVLTNEEWLRTLPAESRVKEVLSRGFMTEERTAEEFVNWLKEKHK